MKVARTSALLSYVCIKIIHLDKWSCALRFLWWLFRWHRGSTTWRSRLCSVGISNTIMCCEIGFLLNHILCGSITSCPSFKLALYSQCHQPNCKALDSFVISLKVQWDLQIQHLKLHIYLVLPNISLTGKCHWVWANYLLIPNLPSRSHTVLAHACVDLLLLYHFRWLLQISYSIVSLLHVNRLSWVPQPLFDKYS